MTKVVGITGIIGTGKSLAAKYISEKYGFVLIDVDKIGHQLLETDSPVYEKIIKEFGTNNRSKIANQVFRNLERLQSLNNILHPWIFKKVQEQIEKFKGFKGNDKIIIDAALLFQIGLDKFCQKIFCTVSTTDNIFERLIQKGLNKKQINERLANIPLIPEEETIIIENNSNIEDFYNKLDTYKTVFN